MSEKPIIFSTPMVQAILANRKTQTRRVVKPQPTEEYVQVSPLYLSPSESRYYVNFSDVKDEHCKTFYPKYQPGDVLWVRETYGIEQLAGGSPINGAPADPRYIYKATDDIPDDEYHFSGWRPSIYMPRAAARIFLRVTDVSVERLQGISKEDAIKEGFEGVPCSCNRIACTDCMNTGWLEPPTVDFMYTWDSLNAKRKVKKYSKNPMIAMQQNITNQQNDFSWESNPWVWKISFERVNL